MKKKFFICLCLLLFTFIKGQNADYRILFALNSNNHLPAWDRGMKILSFTTYPAAFVSVAGILTQGYVKKDKALIRSGYKAGLSITLAAGLSLGAKYLVKRTRPAQEYPGSIIERDEHSGSYSFPSGHTTVAFATATALSLTCKKWYIVLPAYAYAGFIGYSRMRLGLHYPTDILGGIVSGIGSGLLTWQLDKMLRKK